MMILAAFLLLSYVTRTNCLTQPSVVNLQKTITEDFDVYDVDSAVLSSGSNLLYHGHVTGVYESTGRAYSAYYAYLNPRYFSFEPPTKYGCTERKKTSESSVDQNCDYATNGAFFNMNYPNGSLCIGNLISDGKVWQLPDDGTGTLRAQYGVTTDGKIVAGFISNTTIMSNKFSFSTLITGWGWLVRNGENWVNSSQDLSYSAGGFTLEKAPRTAVGYLKNGSMILLEIDGEEDILAGPDLFESAELLIKLGAEIAVNIDGGGSSVSVYQGVVVDYPTCEDTPEMCEREVATIACVKKS